MEKNYRLRNLTSKWQKLTWKFDYLQKIAFFDNEWWKQLWKSLYYWKLQENLRVVLFSFCTTDIYHRQNWKLNVRQELDFFADIYFCMNIMTTIVSENTLLVSWQSPSVTIRKVEKSTERSCQSKKCHKCMEWKWRGIFLTIFKHPVLPVDTTKINLSYLTYTKKIYHEY